MTPGSRLPDRPVTDSVTGLGDPAVQDPSRALDAVLPTEVTAPSVGRAHVRAFARECGRISVQAAETAELLVSELVTNAFEAAGHTAAMPHSSWRQPDIRLSLRYFPGELLIEVIDRSPAVPEPASPGRESEHGRGLLLVEALSRQWGWFPIPGGGKCVYCRLATED
jgi:anti-sigma regulatory factor (Ser/Thr protein kinase)